MAAVLCAAAGEENADAVKVSEAASMVRFRQSSETVRTLTASYYGC
jgi:hypothetical protein